MKTAPPMYRASENAAADVARIMRKIRPASAFVIFDARVRSRANEILRGIRGAGVGIVGAIGIVGGERVKTPDMATTIQRALAKSGAERSSMLVAVGGGTVTDLAGYAAATYMRGIAWLPVATTVLAMADAAIGGKTGVDLPEGKNLIGAFWQPRATIADLASIDTLPRAQRSTGMAEIIKAAIIGDRALFRACERFDIAATGAGWGPLIERAVAVKMRIVKRDPHERGERAKLNLGHTVGHALESAGGFRISHGAAVAVGLRAAGLLALDRRLWKKSDHARVLRVMSSAGLALHAPSASSSGAFDALRADKKRARGVHHFVLPTAIGAVIHGVAIGDDEVRRVMSICARAPRGDEFGA